MIFTRKAQCAASSISCNAVCMLLLQLSCQSSAYSGTSLPCLQQCSMSRPNSWPSPSLRTSGGSSSFGGRRMTSQFQFGSRTSCQSGIDPMVLSAEPSGATTLEEISSSFLASGTTSVPFLNLDVLIFVAGLIPFVWAGIEFWRRIAFGEPFGTGSDSVIIGEDNNRQSSRGQRVLGNDALTLAYILFGAAFFVVAVVIFSVASSPPLPADTDILGDYKGQPFSI